MTTPRQYIPVTALPAGVKTEVIQYQHQNDNKVTQAAYLNENGEFRGIQARDATGKPVRIMAVQVVSSPTKNPGNGHHLVTGTAAPKQIFSPQRNMPALAVTQPVTQVLYSPLQPPVKRPADERMDHEYAFADSKRRKDKGGKGLRHFSMKVCEKVQRKGTTSYNEVADELVAEFTANQPPSAFQDQCYDQKNIRRRVYDALNVLMAMNIISKERKEIKWIGLPTNSAQECQNLELEKQRRLERVKHKTQQLQELILQQIAFKNLVERNKQHEAMHGPPSASSAIQLPFIVVNTNKKTVIDCSISSDKYEYLFNFDNTFEIHDDIEVLKRMGMAFGLDKGQCSSDNIMKAVKLVPNALSSYVQDMASAHPENPLCAGVNASPGPSTSGMPPSGGNLLAQHASAFMDEGDEEEEEEGSMSDPRVASRQSSVSLSNHLSPEEDDEDSRDMNEEDDYDSDDSNIDV